MFNVAFSKLESIEHGTMKPRKSDQPVMRTTGHAMMPNYWPNGKSERGVTK